MEGKANRTGGNPYCARLKRAPMESSAENRSCRTKRRSEASGCVAGCISDKDGTKLIRADAFEWRPNPSRAFPEYPLAERRYREPDREIGECRICRRVPSSRRRAVP